MTSEQLCLALLVLTVGLLLYAEFNRRANASRIAALLAIVTILGADYFFIKAMPFGSGWDSVFDYERPIREARRSGYDGPPPFLAHLTEWRLRERLRQRGFYSDDNRSSEKADAGEGAMPDEEQERAPSPAASARDFGGALEGMGRSLAQWLRYWLATPDRTATALAAVHIFKDCPDCPEMVRIPAGTQTIGADDTDAFADAAEKPLRNMRLWPGFAIARIEITNQQLEAAGIVRRSDGACRSAAEAHPEMPAACVSAREMEAYVDWLSARTGRRYRLPSADEWEFAARASVGDDRGADRMSGGLAEMASDCWPRAIAATQIVSADDTETQITRCSHRVVKDGADDEAGYWKRASARRAFDAAARSAQIGFRVMRPFDLSARKGF